MTNVGWSTLDVIPSVKGLAGELDRQTRGQFAAAGRRGGRQFGDAAGKEAGGRFTGALRTSLRGLAAPLAGLAAGLGGVRVFGDMIAEAQEAAKVTRITEQLIRTTGGAANLTAAQVGNLAAKLSDYAAVDDEAIQSGENVLLTFRNVRNEIGQGNDIFNRATKAALDMSTVLGSDLNGAVLQLGKALQDPLKGITALGRAGVQFSAAQRNQIKAFVENNDLLSAQKLILGELERQVGGAAGANATAIDRLQVSFKNLEEAAGTALAPALNKLATVTTNDLIPALEGAGGVASDAAHAFGDLPTPVKTAAAAFVALRLAALTGIGTALASGATAAGSALTGLRIRAMLAADAYQQLRVGQLTVTNGSGQFIAGVGRMSASLGALSAAGVGAGAGLRRGLSRVTSLVGGPWGLAFIAGTAILTKFWTEHQKAKARIEEFTSTLDKETGALTENSKEWAARELLQSGALKAARDLGVSTSLMTDAVLHGGSALDSLTTQLQGVVDAQAHYAGAARGANAANNEQISAVNTIREAVGGLGGAVRQGSADWQLLSSAQGKSASATEGVARITDTYATKLDKARTAVQKLLDKENERRNANLSAFQDQTRLAEALAAARKEAKKGAETLDANTKAGRANRDALASLADAWNSSSDKVKNAKGAYHDMRQNFIDLAEKMGASDTKAKKLADRLLGIPPKTPARVTTPGMDEALANFKELRRQARATAGLYRIAISNQAAKNRDFFESHATGGLIGGRGTGTSDSNLIWASRGEFMQRKAAVDYYGVEFMRRLNSLQVPRYASGGLVGAAPSTAAPVMGQEIAGALRIVDGVAWIEGVARQVDVREQRSRRLSSLDGVRRP